MAAQRKRCAIYTRKSSEEGLEQDFNSLHAQREACEAYIKSQSGEGWEALNAPYDDGGISGGTMDRPGLQSLLKDVQKGRVDVIVVYKVDRLTRSLVDFARIVELLDAQGVSFVSVTQQFNTTTSMGRLTLNVLLSFAQFEREVTSERIKDKIAASKKKGMWMGGYPPLGYDIQNRRLVPNPAEAETIRLIFQRYTELRSIVKLGQDLKTRGITGKSWKTQKGKVHKAGYLTNGGLQRLLRNPIYIGKIRHGEIIHEGDHEAILDEALWRRVQDLLTDSARRSKETRKTPQLLTGKVYDDAGNLMGPTYSKGSSGKKNYYYASRALLTGQKENAGNLSRVRADVLEEAVWTAIGGEGALAEASVADAFADVSRVDVGTEGLQICLKDGENDPEVIDFAIDLSRPSHAKEVLGMPVESQDNESLIRSIAQAMYGIKELEAGRLASVSEIAKRVGISERYAWKVIGLAFLSPSIVRDALSEQTRFGPSLRSMNSQPHSSQWRPQAGMGGVFHSS